MSRFRYVAAEFGHHVFSDLVSKAYQCDVCDFDKLQETFKRIENDYKSDITGVIAVRVVSFVDSLLMIFYMSECWHLRRQTRVGVEPRGFPEGLWCQRLRRVQYLSCGCQVGYLVSSFVCIIDVDLSCRLWTDSNKAGSIVITASMSAQIINQASRNKALTQVSIVLSPYGVGTEFCEGVLQFVQGCGSPSLEGARCRVGREAHSR